MSFINTIEDDSDQVELIVRQRLEAKPGCNIVGFDAYDQASAVTELSTQLSSNSSRIDGIVASLSNTDSNVVAFNSNLLAAIANTASNTVTNASLVSDLRSDVDSNSALTTNLQANTVAITSDLASNSALVSGLRTDLDANTTLLSSTTARVTVVEQNTSNLWENSSPCSLRRWRDTRRRCRRRSRRRARSEFTRKTARSARSASLPCFVESGEKPFCLSTARLSRRT